MKKTLTKAAIAVALIAGAFYLGRSSAPELKETVKYKERIKREIVRVTSPDGTVRETIREREDRNGSRVKVVNKRNWRVGLTADPSAPSNLNLGVGYRVLSNVSIQGNLTLIDGQVTPMVGVSIDF